jgi:peptidoglycan/LPS O-acetylase OafA/YrhL
VVFRKQVARRPPRGASLRPVPPPVKGPLRRFAPLTDSSRPNYRASIEEDVPTRSDVRRRPTSCVAISSQGAAAPPPLVRSGLGPGKHNKTVRLAAAPRRTRGPPKHLCHVCVRWTDDFAIHLTAHRLPATLASMTRGDKLGYRPALDGLRGIAVLLVIACHAVPDRLGGAGSVGVTVFFVLSGYLITTILRRELADTGRINFRAFYGRRARRLLPALGLLLVAAAGYLLDSHQSLGPIAVTAGYASNFVSATGFNLGVLNHTWTLSLEEQYYLLWPLLMLVVARRRHPVLILGSVAVVSVGLRCGLWLAGATIDRVYYAPDTRADAILVGCALAFIAIGTGGRWIKPAAVVSAATLTVACLTAWSVLVWLLFPLAVGSAALVACAAQYPVRVLAWRPLVFTGKISYGLYLWNLPASLALQQWDAPGWVLTVALFGVSFALAIVSWYVIERPFMRTPVKVSAATFAEVVALKAEVHPARQEARPAGSGFPEPSAKGIA